MLQNDEISQLKAELNIKESEIEEISSTLEAKTQEYEAFVAAKDTEINQLSAAFADKTRECEGLSASISAKDALIAEQHRINQEATSAVAETSALINRLAAESESLVADKTTLTAQLSTANDTIRALELKIAQLEEARPAAANAAPAALEEAQDKNRALAAEMEETKIHYRKLHESALLVEKDRDRLHAELEKELENPSAPGGTFKRVVGVVKFAETASTGNADWNHGELRRLVFDLVQTMVPKQASRADLDRKVQEVSHTLNTTQPPALTPNRPRRRSTARCSTYAPRSSTTAPCASARTACCSRGCPSRRRRSAGVAGAQTVAAVGAAMAEAATSMGFSEELYYLLCREGREAQRVAAGGRRQGCRKTPAGRGIKFIRPGVLGPQKVVDYCTLLKFKKKRLFSFPLFRGFFCDETIKSKSTCSICHGFPPIRSVCRMQL